MNRRQMLADQAAATVDAAIARKGGASAVVARATRGTQSTLPTVQLMEGDGVKLEPVHWLWPGYLPLSMLTILGGSPGCGKTTIALWLAAAVTRAGTWPDGSRCHQAGDVIVWSGEDAHSILAARLVASGADMKRVRFVGGTVDQTGERESFDPGRDMPLLESALQLLRAPRLLILDPIVSAVSGDSHKSADVRRALQPVVDLAQRAGCAVIGITHFSKNTAGREPIERVTGSIAFAALARMVLVAAKVNPAEPDGDGEPRRVLLRAKSNIGPDTGGFAYELERVEVAPHVEGQRVHWLERLNGTARELLAEAEADPEEDQGNDADRFLRGLLADGPMPARAIKADADGAGYAWRTMQLAATRLKVERRKQGMKDGWVWTLPVDAPSRRRNEDAEGATCKASGSSCAFTEVGSPNAQEGADTLHVAPSAPSGHFVAPSESHAPSDADDDEEL